MTRQDTDVLQSWVEYKLTRDVTLRNKLVERYLPLVRYTAERLSAKLPDEVESDDLYSAGVFGLMSAVDGFKPERGFKFETFAAPRIRGAMLDHLRSMDWVPRLVRSRAHQLDVALGELEARLGRSPTEEEACAHMGMSADEYRRFAKDAAAVSLVSLSKKWFETDGAKDVREIDLLEDKRGDNPMGRIQLRDLKNLITRGLSRTERLIIVLYYYEELTMKEIGATLDLSESRVSQMHSGIIARLKTQIGSRRGEFSEA